jgi:NAD-dependent SIR2 family protein deacetylase
MTDDNTRGMEECARAAGTLRNCRRLLVLTGAGISAESGMQTYRGASGTYTSNPNLRSLMSAEGFASDPEKVWQQIANMRLQAAESQPNEAHRILAKWEREQRFADFLIATQNIDGLHQKAGSERVSELHGSLWQLACPRAIDFTEDAQFSEDVEFMAYPEMRSGILQRWSEENQQRIWKDRSVPFPQIPPSDVSGVRPNVLLFDEPYGSRLVWVEDFIRGAPDAVLVIGCSGQVALLPLLLQRCREANPECVIININPHEDCVEIPHEYVPLSATLALSAIDSLMA